jgi:hypothetical protein
MTWTSSARTFAARRLRGARDVHHTPQRDVGLFLDRALILHCGLSSAFAAVAPCSRSPRVPVVGAVLGIKKRHELIVEWRDARIEYFIRDFIQTEDLSTQRDDLGVVAGACDRRRGAFQRGADGRSCSGGEE